MKIQAREGPGASQSQGKLLGFSWAFPAFVLNLVPNAGLQSPLPGCWDLRCCHLSQGSTKAVASLSFLGEGPVCFVRRKSMSGALKEVTLAEVMPIKVSDALVTTFVYLSSALRWCAPPISVAGPKRTRWRIAYARTYKQARACVLVISAGCCGSVHTCTDV